MKFASVHVSELEGGIVQTKPARHSTVAQYELNQLGKPPDV